MGLVIIVEGLIGAGKSTLTQALGHVLGQDTLVLMEPDEQKNANPYLADFYENKERWSFTMQTHLLGMRYRMQLAAQWHALCGRGHAICDRSFYGDTCFARMMNNTGEISNREFETYRVIYQAMTASVLLPSVCVRLKVDPEVAADRIRGRASMRDGRKSELSIDLSYLRALDEEIDTTVSVLQEQGVRVIPLQWNDDLTSTATSRQAIEQLATSIIDMSPPDLFLQHHRRVTI